MWTKERLRSREKIDQILAVQKSRIARQDQALELDINLSYSSHHRRQVLAKVGHRPRGQEAIQCKFLNEDDVDSIFKKFVDSLRDEIKSALTSASQSFSRRFFCFQEKSSKFRSSEEDETEEDVQNHGLPLALLTYYNGGQPS